MESGSVNPVRISASSRLGVRTSQFFARSKKTVLARSAFQSRKRIFGSNTTVVPAPRKDSTTLDVSARFESLNAGVIPVTKRYFAVSEAHDSAFGAPGGD